MLIDGEKWACDACVRGHRVSNCQHSGERDLGTARSTPSRLEAVEIYPRFALHGPTIPRLMANLRERKIDHSNTSTRRVVQSHNASTVEDCERPDRHMSNVNVERQRTPRPIVSKSTGTIARRVSQVFRGAAIRHGSNSSTS